MGTVGGVHPPRLAPLVVVDAAERPLLVADAAEEVAAANGASDLLRQRCREVRGGAPYGIMVSPDTIRIYQGVGAEPILRLATAEVLGSYHPLWDVWRHAPNHLLTLAEAWLSDLAWRWRGQPVPGEAALDAIGLGARLRAAAPLHVHPDEHGGLRP